MERLTDFKPLKHVKLPGLGELECSGLVLVVGPNSSGKSQFLQDLYHRIVGQPRALIVAEEVTLGKPPALTPFLDCLEREGFLVSVVDDSGSKHLRPLTTFVGSGQAAGIVQSTQSEKWYDSYAPDLADFYRRPSEWLAYFGRLLVTALFLERRLTSIIQVGIFDVKSQPPQADLHALYLNEVAKAESLERNSGDVRYGSVARSVEG